VVETQVSVQRNNQPRTLFVRLAADKVDDKVVGLVVTFDDITELAAAQRKAAWSDVARRIAHEIKNPLTPIQLSAERLRRKYMDEVRSDPETFANCTDTIIRQVSDIGRMVDEFSAFARMPRPQMEIVNLATLCRGAMVLPKNAHSEIKFNFEVQTEPIHVFADSQQISQVLTNLLQNAIDAIHGREDLARKTDTPGEVLVRLNKSEGQAVLQVIDNGKGLPSDERDRLTEPYVTTRAKGTGLGLAIVKTILEDHGATLDLAACEETVGTCVTVVIPLISDKDQFFVEPEQLGDGK